jgi:phospholipase/lecithinase/hemolysin
MKSCFCKRVARLANSLWRRSRGRPTARPQCRLALESLEERSLLSADPLSNTLPVPQFDHLYAFGESMSDNGNFFNITGQPVAPYAGGRFSNGPVWVEYLANDLGLGADQLTDLAVSGAGSGSNNVYITDPASPLYSSGLLSQVNNFTAEHPSADPNALYTVWAGINDYARNPADPNQVVANISTAVSDLAAAGARNILVVNLPDLGTLPGIRNLGARTPQLSALSAKHDAALSTALRTLSQQLTGVNIMPLDVHSLFQQMLADPRTYGFTDVTDSALGNTVYTHEPPSTTSDVWMTNPSAMLFWDSIHPTTAGHQFIADDALSVVYHDLGLSRTLTVSNLNDSGFGSLRYELTLAQNGDTIVFDPQLQGTITLTSGELRVGQSVTIQGPGAGNLSIDGNHASRVFEILPGAAATISGLTITDGVANAPGSSTTVGFGGGIFVDRGATLTLTDATVTGNTANAASTSSTSTTQTILGSGGGIYNAGTLTMTGDVITGNTANTGSNVQGFSQVDGSGGGIYNAGTLTLADSAIDYNTANAGSSSFVLGGEGGGLYTSGTLSLTRVSVSHNTANGGAITTDFLPRNVSGLGGGLFVSTGSATVQDSTFLGDTANAVSATGTGIVNVVGDGGGIYNGGQLSVLGGLFSGDVGNAGSASTPGFATVAGHGGAIADLTGLSLARSTLVGNTANAGSVAPGANFLTLVIGLGGGVYSAGAPVLRGDTVMGNTANSGSAPGTVQAGGGGIYAMMDGLFVINSFVTNNIVNTGSAGDLEAAGGGVWTAGGSVLDTVVDFNIVNASGRSAVIHVAGGGIYDTGRLTLQNSVLTFNNVNTDPGSGHGPGGSASYATGGGIDVAGITAELTLNYSTVAGNFALDTASDIHVRDAGMVDPASAGNLIGTGGSGGLINGVNGNVVL